jgi:hypothetical protein
LKVKGEKVVALTLALIKDCRLRASNKIKKKKKKKQELAILSL